MLMEFTRVDNRVCHRCGARAGSCKHIKPDAVKVELWHTDRDSHHFDKWTPRERDKVRRLWEIGNTSTEIAEIMNKTRNAVAGQITRLELRE